MRKPFGKLVLALGTMALLTSLAWAQGRGGFGFGGGVGVLMAPNVQKELKLTEEQVGKLEATLRETREKHTDDFAALKDASQEERQEKMAALTKSMTEEVKKALELTADQAKRFDQIELQARGLQAFASPAVQEKLKLTDDQKSKIREIAEASREAFRGAFNKEASKEERAEARKKMAAATKENMTKVHALLSDDQKSAWKELTGDPVEINIPPRRPAN